MEKKTGEAVVALGELALRFAATNRVTIWPDGMTLESDTDHTVMLGLIACAFAAEFDSALDIGKVAQFALVHDLVEAYSGDTNTFGMRDEDQWQAKTDRETAAFERIKKEFSTTLPWIPNTIAEYESLASKEARFVKTMDKGMPKITRLLNNDALHDSPVEFRKHCVHQLEKMQATYGKDQPEALALYMFLRDAVLAMLDAKTFPTS